MATNQPGYYEELAAVRSGAAPTVPITDAIPGWNARIANARNGQQ